MDSKTGSTAAPKRHVLLIGIDAYERACLNGCIADVLAIEALLKERYEVPDHQIERLWAPHSTLSLDSAKASQKPTLAAIRASLERLAQKVATDRGSVLIYYSGHATRISVPGAQGQTWREALAPLDYPLGGYEPRFLFDYELNHLLGQIAAHASDLTVILDCCHSSGATRKSIEDDEKTRIRELPREEREGVWSEAFLQKLSLPMVPAGARGMEDVRGLVQLGGRQWLVVAACHTGEFSYESPDATGQPRGAFSSALVETLRAWPGDLRKVRWSDIWPLLLDRVERRHPQQHPQALGELERVVFGGLNDAQPRDVGFWVHHAAEGGFRVDGGEIAGLTPGALLHLYRPETLRFPALGSATDQTECVGRLRITRAERAVAWGSLGDATGEGTAPPFLRGRLVLLGEEARLRVGLEPWDVSLKVKLESTGLVMVQPVNEPGIELKVYREDCGYVLRDEIYDLDPIASEEAGRKRGKYELPPELARAADPSDLLGQVEHYGLFVRPLRQARQAFDLPGLLKVTLLQAPMSPSLPPQELQNPPFKPLPPGAGATHTIVDGAGFCVRVENRWERELYVTVLNCTAGCGVEVLGHGRIDGKALQVFWYGGEIGWPFITTSDLGAVSLDRLVVLGTSLPDVDLRFLQLEPLRATLKGTRGTRGPEPLERWTATVTTLRIERGGGGAP